MARSLAEESGISATFICSDIYALPEVLKRQFDIVFTSYGVLCWLPDITGWARVVAGFLRSGGTFYIAELHPFAWVLDQESESSSLNLVYPYFHQAEPLPLEEEGSYADRRAHVENKRTFEWNHSIGEVVTALVDAGLHLEFLHEYPYDVCQMFPSMERREDGWWYLPHEKPVVPLTFSIRARKWGGK